MTTPQSRIFISYSHRGHGPAWKAALVRALQVFETQHLLDVWQDGKIRVSSFWEGDIDQAMNDAQLAVVLLTKEALESEFILNAEFPCLRDRQRNHKLTVFPVVCEECDWRAHDWLRATQAPNGSNPIATLRPDSQERVFRQLANDIAEQLSRVALAELPKGEPSETRLYLDKFPLTRSTGLREEKLIGREQELALLDLAFAQPHTAIVSLVAWGGVGKSMLVQQWLRRLQSDGWFGARRVYAWSFYSQGTTEDRQASEDLFLAHALEWFDVQCEPTLSPWDKGRLLADAVARERTLLILDGIEPLQYPPGPMGGQLRAPGVQSLLKQLARKANNDENLSLCLVTTREPLTDLADFQRRPHATWGSMLRVDLGNLTEEAGAALLHHAGAKRAGAAEIAADDTELLAASREVDGHALTLNLLARFLARAHNGDVRRRDLVKFEEADRTVQGGTTFKMLAAFEDWFDRGSDIYKQQLAILRLLGLFDRPADADCLAALRRPPIISGLTESLFHPRHGILGWAKRPQPIPDETWNAATSFLADVALVAIHDSVNLNECVIDCHPLIREHFARQLHGKNSVAWQSAHRRLYDNLRRGTEDVANPSLMQLEPLYNALSHGCMAGRPEETCEVIYRDRIRRGELAYPLTQLGAHGHELRAIACFFDEPWKSFAPGLIDEAQQWLLHEGGYCLRGLGRLTEALELLRRCEEVKHRGAGQTELAVVHAQSLSELKQALGDVSDAVRDAARSVGLSDSRSIHPLRAVQLRVMSRCRLGDAMHQAGQPSEALVRFREAEAILIEALPQYTQLFSGDGFCYCSLLLGKAEQVSWQTILGIETSDFESSRTNAIQFCDEVEQRTTKARSWEGRAFQGGTFTRALDGLSFGRIALYRMILDRNIRAACDGLGPQFTATVDDLRRANEADMLPHALLSRAWFHFLDGDDRSARSDLDEAWDIAVRGPMRLHMADIHLHRARLFFRENTYPWESPQDDLAVAEKLINDCDYHRRDEELADAKRAILGS